MEKWKIINNFSNYEISTEGRVRNLKTQYILKGRESKSGYLQVFIKNDIDGDFKNQYIHRLVAIHFIENPNNKKEVNHIDGNKLNNTLENLEWCTSSENQKHRQNILGKRKTSQRRIGKFSKDGKLLEEFDSITSAAKSFNKSRVNIDNALQKKQKTAYGYIWKYLN